MGGFTLVDPKQKRAAPNEQQPVILTLDYFKAHPDIEIPKITASVIEDRSKGDALSSSQFCKRLGLLFSALRVARDPGAHGIGTCYSCSCEFECGDICNLVA